MQIQTKPATAIATAAITLLLLTVCAQAVTISDTVQYPDGGLASGRLLIELTQSTNSTGLTYSSFRKVVTVASGSVSVDLAPNTTLQPAGTYYRVTYMLDRSIGNTVEYWHIPTGGPFTIREVRWRNRAPTGYVAQMASGTTWTVPAAIHGLRTRNITVRCEDTSGNYINCAPSVNSLYTVRVTFPVAQSGRLVLNAVSAWSAQNFVKSIAAVTSVVIPQSEHGLSTNQLDVQCFDNSEPAQEVVCSSTVNQVTYAVTVGFVVAQTGYVVISGR